jgi:hypothetical protein
MTNMTDEHFERRLRAMLQADAANAPARSPLATPDGAGQRPRPAPGTGRNRLAPRRVRLPAHQRIRLAVAGGLAVVMTAALSAGLTLTGGSQAPLNASASAAELLARVAAVSAAQPVPRNDQYIYTEATGVTPVSRQPGSDKTTRYTTQSWSPVDGKGGDLIHQQPCQRVPGRLAGLGPLACGYGGIFHLLGDSTFPATYAAARALPTSARQLGTYLKDLQLPSIDSPTVWGELAQLLQFVPVLPPKVAAAVYTLASQQPRITLQHTTDAAGQPGIGISQTGDPSHLQLIFNPSTYQLEGISSSGLIMTPLTPVAGAYSMAILHTAIVNSEPSSRPVHLGVAVSP